MYENITLLQEVKRAMQERITNRASLLIQTAITTNTEIPISLLWRSCSHKIKEKNISSTQTHIITIENGILIK
jgi:hypothetical protein